MPKIKAHLFRDGVPRYIQLRKDKRGTGHVTVWFTGRVPGLTGQVFYREMSDNPYHPQHGVGMSGEIERWKLRSYNGGSRITFDDLTPEQKHSVVNDYAELWETALPDAAKKYADRRNVGWSMLSDF